MISAKPSRTPWRAPYPAARVAGKHHRSSSSERSPREQSHRARCSLRSTNEIGINSLTERLSNTTGRKNNAVLAFPFTDLLYSDSTAQGHSPPTNSHIRHHSWSLTVFDRLREEKKRNGGESENSGGSGYRGDNHSVALSDHLNLTRLGQLFRVRWQCSVLHQRT